MYIYNVMHSLSPPLQKSLKRITPVANKNQPIPKAQHVSLGSSGARGKIPIQISYI